MEIIYTIIGILLPLVAGAILYKNRKKVKDLHDENS